MAISISDLFNTGAPSVSSVTTPSLSLQSNALELISVFSEAGATPNTPTVSGASRTWTQILTKLDGNSLRRYTIFRSLSASANSGALTIDFGGQTQNNMKYTADEATGVDTSGSNGAGAIIQSATNTSNSTSTSITVSLSTFANTSNAAYAGVFNNTGGALTVGSGFTALENDTGLFANSVEWKINDNSPSWSWTSQSVISVAAALEISIPITATNVSFKSLLGVGL